MKEVLIMLALVTKKINNNQFEVRTENQITHTVEPYSKETSLLLEELYEQNIIFDFNQNNQSINSPFYKQLELEFIDGDIGEGV